MKKILDILEMIKFEHTVFALPFAFSSAVVAANEIPALYILGWILLAMVGARSAAMAFNRIVDVKIDKLNPRTSSRALPMGIIAISTAWIVTFISAGLLIFASYKLNPLAFALSPIALAVVLSYSLSKRFTSLSHLWLGLALGIAPVGAWIAVTGRISFTPMVLSSAVICWTAGFDILYSLADVEFDQKMGLFSIPSRLGISNALIVSRALHAVMPLLLVWFGLLAHLGLIYLIGVSLITLFLIYEQSLVKPNDFSKLNTAFFTMNGCVSIFYFIFVLVDILL